VRACVRACVCVCVDVTVCGCGGVVLGVNGEAVEGRNISNDRSQKRCFTIFFSVLLRLILFAYSYLCCVHLSDCHFYCGIRVSNRQIVMHLLRIIKFFLSYHCKILHTQERDELSLENKQISFIDLR